MILFVSVWWEVWGGWELYVKTKLDWRQKIIIQLVVLYSGRHYVLPRRMCNSEALVRGLSNRWTDSQSRRAAHRALSSNWWGPVSGCQVMWSLYFPRPDTLPRQCLRCSVKVRDPPQLLMDIRGHSGSSRISTVLGNGRKQKTYSCYVLMRFLNLSTTFSFPTLIFMNRALSFNC